MVSVRLERRGGDIDLVRPDGVVATLAQPGQPVRRITLSRRQPAECLADELRRLDPDEIYAEALTKGLGKVGRASVTASEAVIEGEAPSVERARKAARKAARRDHSQGSSVMVKAPEPSHAATDDDVKAAAAAQLEARKAGTSAAAAGRRSTRVTASAASATKAAPRKAAPATKSATAKPAAAKKPAPAKKAPAKKSTAKTATGSGRAAPAGAARTARTTRPGGS